MLSKDSRADAIPMLLIDENDVKCGHAASVGQIDEEQLFYLMSRGISETEAKRLVIWGFVEPVLVRMPVDAARIAVEAALERKLR
jgi:Fe-S cluster assembly protein SufD